VSQPATTDSLTLKGELTVIRTVEKATKAMTLDDTALDLVAGGGTYTGGRFQLDVGGHNVGYVPARLIEPATKP